ncbi:MAG: exodeoxyribonuclease VII small subunit [Clostridia bacterium]
MTRNELKFEDALKELEQTVHEMERGDLGLDELLADFEKGIGLLRVCEKKLAEAEGKIAVLTQAEIAAGSDEDDAEEPEMPLEDELPF